NISVETKNGDRNVAIFVTSFFYGIKKAPSFLSALRSSGDQTRTDDLRVMSPTSYQLLHPALFLVIDGSALVVLCYTSSRFQTRSDELRVMSPTSYHLLLPQMFLFLDAASRVVFCSFSSGDQTRTDDLRVMSPTSYQLLHPALFLVTQR